MVDMDTRLAVQISDCASLCCCCACNTVCICFSESLVAQIRLDSRCAGGVRRRRCYNQRLRRLLVASKYSTVEGLGKLEAAGRGKHSRTATQFTCVRSSRKSTSSSRPYSIVLLRPPMLPVFTRIPEHEERLQYGGIRLLTATVTQTLHGAQLSRTNHYSFRVLSP